LKGNQGTLHEDVKLFLDDAITNSGAEQIASTNGGHGRVETRTVYYSEGVSWLRNKINGKDYRA
jgi:hypothetical protein